MSGVIDLTLDDIGKLLKGDSLNRVMLGFGNQIDTQIEIVSQEARELAARELAREKA